MKGLRSAKLMVSLYLLTAGNQSCMNNMERKFHFVWEFCTWIFSAVRYKMDEAENVSFLAAVTVVLR